MTTDAPATARPSVASRLNVGNVLREPLLGPLAALVIAIIIFSSIADSFLNPQNVSLILQQSVVVGILAVGQTLIILTSGIDLSIGAVAVFGTIVMAQSAGANGPMVALGSTLVVCVAFGAINGGLVTSLRLPPFIVTLGTFTAIQAATRLLAGSETYRVEDGLLTFLGTSFRLGSFSTTFGVVAMLLVYLVTWYALSQTGWGKHIYAVGGNPQASNLSGIKSGRVLLSVYIVTGVIAAIAAWAALGRIPNADPNAYQNANLETITAVVIGG
ncbi:MAG: fructose transport system permease protein, partial [Mycobacterium sp.]|nr:fructose transport system permease protein [Mycobacterium sp.]